MSITPKAIQDLLDELEASRQARRRAWDVLQDLRAVLTNLGNVMAKWKKRRIGLHRFGPSASQVPRESLAVQQVFDVLYLAPLGVVFMPLRLSKGKTAILFSAIAVSAPL
jgi:hypothetical protein